MRVQHGPHQHHTTDGVYCNTDQPLSSEQVDFLVGLMRQHGRCPSCTSAVEVTEAGVKIEPAEPSKWDLCNCRKDTA